MAETTHAITEAPSETHGGFPPFDKETFASQLFWLALTFIFLYVVMKRVALPRIGSIIEARNRRIESDLADAEALRTESDAAMTAYEKAMDDARSRAQA